MNVWKLTAAKMLSKTEEPNPEPEEGKYKVRVTKLLVNGVDAAIFRGATKVKYPLVPCRYAVGLVAEQTDNPLFPKGTRVLLHTYVPAPYGGTAKKDFAESETGVCGRTQDGFLRDFVMADKDGMTPLPDSVSDENALLLHHIAHAKAAVEALGAQKGEHIAVVGGDLLGILICQLLIYQQISPILIDADKARLDFARACGVYYTMLADGGLLPAVAEVTGGRLTEGAIYVTSASGNPIGLPFSVCAQERRVVLCGCETGCLSSVDLAPVLGKELELIGVHDGRGSIETAINLIVSGALDLSDFRASFSNADGAARVLGELSEGTDSDPGKLHVLSMI